MTYIRSVREINEDLDSVYILGDESTDGSLRLIPDTSFSTEVEFQRRNEGVWNDTGILIAASTVYLGRELRISAAGEFILTRDVSERIKSLVPHVVYDDATGSQEFITVPLAGELQNEVPVQPDFSGEITGSIIEFTAPWTLETALLSLVDLKTGSTAASDAVLLQVWRGTDDTGELFFQRTYPADQLPANSDVFLDTNGLVEVKNGDNVFFRLTAASGTISLLADVTNTIPYLAFDLYYLTEDKITPDEQGGALYLLTFDNEALIVGDNEGYPVLDESEFL